MAQLFISQQRVDFWHGQDKLRIEDNRLTLVELGESFTIEPAARILRVLGQDSDPNDLVGTVWSVRSLEERGAEIVEDSLLLEDSAYDMQPGFLGTVCEK